MAHFSFNKPAGACPTCTGLGTVQQVNLDRLVDPQRSILESAVTGWDAFTIQHNSQILQAAARHYGFTFDPAAAGEPVQPGAARPADLRRG